MTSWVVVVAAAWLAFLTGLIAGRTYERRWQARRRGGMLPVATPVEIEERWRIPKAPACSEPYDQARDPVSAVPGVRASVGHPLVPAPASVGPVDEMARVHTDPKHRCDGTMRFASLAAAVEVARAMDIARDPHSRRVDAETAAESYRRRKPLKADEKGLA